MYSHNVGSLRGTLGTPRASVFRSKLALEPEDRSQPLLAGKPHPEVTCQDSNAEYVRYLPTQGGALSPAAEAGADLLRKWLVFPYM